MKVLIACEFSGRVRDAFVKRGHDAWSCDLRETEVPGNHIQRDALEAIAGQNWDLLVAHPPCTHLAVSGARWFAAKNRDHPEWQADAIKFFLAMVNADVPLIAVENPICIMSRIWRKPDQVIQPWQFGHGETKSTCLWLKNLPLLKPTNIVSGRADRIHRMRPGPERERERSRTYEGIAEAMAAQWGTCDPGRNAE